MPIFRKFSLNIPDCPARIRLCDHPGCTEPGLYRAPKSRNQLNEYYFFCLNHVQEYNKAWNFFSGLSPEEVESYTRNATVWERPSWPLGQWGEAERALRHKALHDIFGQAPQDSPPTNAPSLSGTEREALAVLGLVPPLDFSAIKARYRELVKKHHPDLHGGTRQSEETFKQINLAFATLRDLYEEVKV
ncbi:MAG: DnaJ domain-containing protein [Alphaproteobacteria bacterium]|nr:DnaJ domain-containing protein [Alphaproteobacteria bacterium]